jgi:hypothetical protein
MCVLFDGDYADLDALEDSDDQELFYHYLRDGIEASNSNRCDVVLGFEIG